MGLHEGVIYIQQHDPNQPHQIIVQQQPVVSEHGQGGVYTFLVVICLLSQLGLLV